MRPILVPGQCQLRDHSGLALVRAGKFALRSEAGRT